MEPLARAKLKLLSIDDQRDSQGRVLLNFEEVIDQTIPQDRRLFLNGGTLNRVYATDNPLVIENAKIGDIYLVSLERFDPQPV